MNPRHSLAHATLVALTLATPSVYAQTPGSTATPAAAPVDASISPSISSSGEPSGEPSISPSGEPSGEPPAITSPEVLRAFEGGFDAGQTLLERGQPLAAARTWVETARLLPEGPEHRDTRAAMFGYIADAFERALSGPVPRAQIEEALAALDQYVEIVEATYASGAAIVPRVAAVRGALRTRLEAMDRATRPAASTSVLPAKPAPPTKVETRAWGGLAAGGGAALGVGVGGLAMMVVAAVRGRALEQRFDEPARGCDRNAPTGECGEIFRAGREMNTQLIAGAVIGAAGLIAGTTLVALAHRRRVAAAPRVGPGFAGVVVQGRF